MVYGKMGYDSRSGLRRRWCRSNFGCADGIGASWHEAREGPSPTVEQLFSTISGVAGYSKPAG